jgi:hypothetical protein
MQQRNANAIKGWYMNSKENLKIDVKRKKKAHPIGQADGRRM